MSPARRPKMATLTLAALAGLAPLACNQPGGPSAARPQAKTRPILGERTTDVRDAAPETKDAGAVAVAPQITAKDPITLAGNAYVTAIGQTSILLIKQAVDLYQAETGEYPKTFAEFQEKVLKPNNIALPTLPYYQEYGYDVPSHSLLILEYPDRKAAANPPR